MIQLLISRGKNKGKVFTLVSFPVIIGRDRLSQIVLDDAEVSRSHFRIKKRGQLYILEDLDSKNGCYLNGDKVKNAVIENRDKILVGETELLFFKPSGDITISAEISDYQIELDQESQVKNDIEAESSNIEVAPVFHSELLNKSAANTKNLKQTHDFITNIMASLTLEDAGSTLLRSIGEFSSELSRAAIFNCVPNDNLLVPFSSREFSTNKKQLLVNARILGECMVRKQGLMIQAKENHNEPHRIVLPIIHHNAVISIAHLEFDDIKGKIPVEKLELIQNLLFRSAANIDTLLLRSEIDKLVLGTVEALVACIEAKDTYTLGHSERVCRFSLAIGDQLALNKETKKLLMMSSLCHDIGKIGIPDAILKKAAMLSTEEYEEMRQHPSIGANIIAHMPNANRFMSGIKYHHEKWDGTGYPEGLEGENIPFFGRIVAVADVFDAMISGRSYSGFIDESEAIERIQKEIELFDPEIVKALVKAWDAGAITHRTSTLSEAEPDLDPKPSS